MNYDDMENHIMHTFFTEFSVPKICLNDWERRMFEQMVGNLKLTFTAHHLYSSILPQIEIERTNERSTDAEVAGCNWIKRNI